MLQFRKFLVGLFGLGLLAVTVSACSPSGTKGAPASDDAKLVALDIEYREAIDARDFDRVIDLSMPPRLMTALAEFAGAPTDTPPDVLADAVRVEIATAFSSLDTFEYTMDLDRATIQKTDTGRDYSLIPTVVDMQMNDMKMRADGITVALVDDSRWYLLNPSDTDTVNLIKEVYPDLKPVKIVPNKIEVLK